MSPQIKRLFILLVFGLFIGSRFQVPPVRHSLNSQELTCFANMRILLGAIERYNMDNNPMLDQDPVTCIIPLSPLTSGNPPVLSSPVQCPENGQYLAGPEKWTDGGNLFCSVHGYLTPGPEPSPPLREEFPRRCAKAGLNPAQFRVDLSHHDPTKGAAPAPSASFSRWVLAYLSPATLVLSFFFLPPLLIFVDRRLSLNALFSSLAISVGLCLSSTFFIFGNLVSGIGFSPSGNLPLFGLVFPVSFFWWVICAAITVFRAVKGVAVPRLSALFAFGGFILYTAMTQGGFFLIPFFGLAYTWVSLQTILQNAQA